MGKWPVQPLGQAGSEKVSCGDSKWRWSRDVTWKGLWRVSLGTGVGWEGSCSLQPGAPLLIFPSTSASDWASQSPQS